MSQDQVVDMAVKVAGLALKNPVMTASGTCGYGVELEPFFDPCRLGALVVKGLSLAPRSGNAPPRIAETCGGLLNAIGLQNIGVDAFVSDCLPELRKYDTVLIVNVFGESRDAYVELAERLDGEVGVHGLEINVSCPNVKKGGLAFGVDGKELEGLVGSIRKRVRKPLVVKLSPNVTDIVDIARRAEAAGADALSLINTLRGMSVDVHSRRPRLSTVTGGLSGPAIKPVALRMVWEVSQHVDIPVIGMGGILTAEDALEFLICGASAVQVGTAMLRTPLACMEILEGMEAFLLEQGVARVADMVGSLTLGNEAAC